jgi:hypothetical protein
MSVSHLSVLVGNLIHAIAPNLQADLADNYGIAAHRPQLWQLSIEGRILGLSLLPSEQTL